MSRLARPAAAVVLFAAAGPLLLWLTNLTSVLIPTNLVFIGLQAIAATGLVLVMGFSGQVSLGHAAFYGIGAYATALLTVDLQIAPVLAMLVGAAVAAVAAAALGRAVFRLSGHFLAMATLAFGLFFFYLLTFAGGITGGNAGTGDIPELQLGPVVFDTDRSMFLLVWLVLGVGIVVARNIVRSPVGRALRATGAAETAAACSGVDVVRAKLGIFAVGAVYASIAGSLYAHYVNYIAPDAFGLLANVQFLVVATVGGLTSIWGGLVGAAFVTALTEVTRAVVPRFVDGATGSYETVAYGAALVIVLVVFHKGIADAVADLFRTRAHAALDAAQEAGGPAPTPVGSGAAEERA